MVSDRGGLVLVCGAAIVSGDQRPNRERAARLLLLAAASPTWGIGRSSLPNSGLRPILGLACAARLVAPFNALSAWGLLSWLLNGNVSVSYCWFLRSRRGKFNCLNFVAGNPKAMLAIVDPSVFSPQSQISICRSRSVGSDDRNGSRPQYPGSFVSSLRVTVTNFSFIFPNFQPPAVGTA